MAITAAWAAKRQLKRVRLARRAFRVSSFVSCSPQETRARFERSEVGGKRRAAPGALVGLPGLYRARNRPATAAVSTAVNRSGGRPGNEQGGAA
jgi:hypothetical protein